MSPSDAGRCVLYTDGGSRGNPGPAGSGIVLIGPTGDRICTAGRFIGDATNNQAEYDALIWGLGLAHQYGCRSIEVRMDSELIVRQMTGRYRVKNEGLKPLFADAGRIAAGFQSVRFVHVRREQNTEADRMANEAMDARGAVGDAEAITGLPGAQESLF